MASQDECVARFAGQQVCVNRSYSRLLAWAAYTSALPLPPTDTAPDDAAVRQRIVAERAPMQAPVYAAQLGPFLMEEPLMTSRVREHLSEWNDEATEGEPAVELLGVDPGRLIYSLINAVKELKAEVDALKGGVLA